MREAFAVIVGARDAGIPWFRRQRPLAGPCVASRWTTRSAATSHRAGWRIASGTGPAIPSGAKSMAWGANMDNMEAHDERPVIPSTCFSVEPALYLPTFGVRTEVNVFVQERGARVTGEIQTEFVKL